MTLSIPERVVLKVVAASKSIGLTTLAIYLEREGVAADETYAVVESLRRKGAVSLVERARTTEVTATARGRYASEWTVGA